MKAVLKKFRRRKEVVPQIEELAARFEVRERFLSNVELQCHTLLCQSIGGRAVVCSKPRVLETLRVLDAHWHLEDALRIDRKHIDFLLCDSTNGSPLCVVQIEWWNEEKSEYHPRDQLLDQAFGLAGLPVANVQSNRLPTVGQMRQQIEDLIGTGSDEEIAEKITEEGTEKIIRSHGPHDHDAVSPTETEQSVKL